MSRKFICNVSHPDAGEIEVFETQNGARIYGISEKLGMIPFQDKKRQDELRGLVIAMGLGDDLKRKPTMLEVANHAPVTPESFTVSVTDELPGKAPETVEPVPVESESKKGFFGRGIFK